MATATYRCRCHTCCSPVRSTGQLCLVALVSSQTYVSKHLSGAAATAAVLHMTACLCVLHYARTQSCPCSKSVEVDSSLHAWRLSAHARVCLCAAFVWLQLPCRRGWRPHGRQALTREAQPCWVQQCSARASGSAPLRRLPCCATLAAVRSSWTSLVSAGGCCHLARMRVHGL